MAESGRYQDLVDVIRFHRSNQSVSRPIYSDLLLRVYHWEDMGGMA